MAIRNIKRPFLLGWHKRIDPAQSRKQIANEYIGGRNGPDRLGYLTWTVAFDGTRHWRSRWP